MFSRHNTSKTSAETIGGQVSTKRTTSTPPHNSPNLLMPPSERGTEQPEQSNLTLPAFLMSMLQAY